MGYPPKIAQLAAHPIHASGDELDATGTGANFTCGCIIRFGVSVDVVSGRVSNAAFSTNGCGYLIAAAEIAAAAVFDLRMTELRGSVAAVIEGFLARELGDCPIGRRECLASVTAAAAAAFASHRARRAREYRGEVALICTCFGVTEDRIRDAISRRRLRTVAEVGEKTNAGTGCGSCQMLIRELLDEPVTGDAGDDAW